MWKSHKLRRVVKSAMAAETIIQVDSAESSFWLKSIFNELLYSHPVSSKIRIICRTDSSQLKDAVYSIRGIEDRRLRIEIALLREMLERKEIDKIERIEGSQQLADCLTKSGASNSKLLETLMNAKIN